MDLRRIGFERGQKWALSGTVHDREVLELESKVLNSEFRGGEMVLDLSRVECLSPEALNGLRHIADHVAKRGGSMKLIGPPEEICRKNVDQNSSADMSS